MANPLIKLSWRERLLGVSKAVRRKSWNFGNWLPLIRESYTGAWQSGVTLSNTTVSANWAVFSCISLISNDIAKLPAFVMRFNETLKIWEKVIKRKVLDTPNNFQVWTDFVRSWVTSLLLTGNAYILRQLDRDGFVVALYVLDPRSVRPLVTPSGQIYYQVSADNLVGIVESLTIPADQIIHDRINTLWHPLCGVSPLYASGVAAVQGLAMQDNSAKFFQNMSRPGGILTAPGTISEESATALKEYWNTEFAGDSAGKIAVVGDGLKYETFAMTAADSQLIEQLKFTGEMICATFHVPPYKLGIGTPPSVGNIAALNQQYYDQALHPIVEAMERRLDAGLDIKYPEQIWFDTEELLRMDPVSRWESYAKALGAGALAPNEARRKEQLPPLEGGDTAYLQQQNYSLSDLALRSSRDRAKGEAETNPQTLALAGGQITSLIQLLTSGAQEQLPLDTLKAALQASFPTLTPEQIEALVKPLESFDPEPATPPTSGASPSEPASSNQGPDPTQEDPADLENAFEAMRRRLLEMTE